MRLEGQVSGDELEVVVVGQRPDGLDELVLRQSGWKSPNDNLVKRNETDKFGCLVGFCTTINELKHSLLLGAISQLSLLAIGAR